MSPEQKFFPRRWLCAICRKPIECEADAWTWESPSGPLPVHDGECMEILDARIAAKAHGS